MAENVVHFSVTSQTKPTIFEIIAQESLAATVHPALKRFIEFLATTKPEYFNRILSFYDEIYLALSGFIEYYYIKNYDASFSETFYGLKRICTTAHIKNDVLELTIKKRCLSFACVVLLPYIYRKIENESKHLSLSQDNKHEKLKTVLKILHFIKFIWKSYELVQLLAYVSGGTQYYSPLLKLCKISLIYGPANLPSIWSWTDIWTNKVKLSTALGTGLLRLFEVGAFFIQFFHSWSSENYQFNIAALPTPSPPEIDNAAKKYIGKCPVCLQNWKTPTALQVSGYIFCYKCISMYLKNHSCCPVTQYPATADDLIRLYYNIAK